MSSWCGHTTLWNGQSAAIEWSRKTSKSHGPRWSEIVCCPEVQSTCSTSLLWKESWQAASWWLSGEQRLTHFVFSELQHHISVAFTWQDLPGLCSKYEAQECLGSIKIIAYIHSLTCYLYFMFLVELNVWAGYAGLSQGRERELFEQVCDKYQARGMKISKSLSLNQEFRISTHCTMLHFNEHLNVLTRWQPLSLR